MIAKVTNTLLSRLFKLQIVRMPRPQQMRFRPSAAEIAQIDETLVRFAALQAPDDPAAYQDSWRAYLSDTRVNFSAEILEQLTQLDIDLTHKRIGDFGSGTGYLLRLLSQLEPTVTLTGFDTFAEANALAKLLCPSAELIDTDITAGVEPFDALFCVEVLEHMVDPQSRLRTLLAAVKPGGVLILSVPNGRTDTQSARTMREDGTSYWGHINFWSPESWHLFIAASAKDQATFTTSLIDSGANVAVIRKH